VDNANLLELEPYRSDQRRAYNGRGLAILKAGESGVLQVNASSAGLRPSTVKVRVVRGFVPETLPAARRK
jgi:hypothetical protein